MYLKKRGGQNYYAILICYGLPKSDNMTEHLSTCQGNLVDQKSDTCKVS